MSVFSSVSSPKLRWISILVFAISCIILDNHNDKNNHFLVAIFIYCLIWNGTHSKEVLFGFYVDIGVCYRVLNCLLWFTWFCMPWNDEGNIKLFLDFNFEFYLNLTESFNALDLFSKLFISYYILNSIFFVLIYFLRS